MSEHELAREEHNEQRYHVTSSLIVWKVNRSGGSREDFHMHLVHLVVEHGLCLDRKEQKKREGRKKKGKERKKRENTKRECHLYGANCSHYASNTNV